MNEDTTLSSSTGFYTDDEDIESSIEHNTETVTRFGQETEVNTRYTYKELNEIMLDKVCSDEYRNLVKESSGLSSVQVNITPESLQDKSEKYPEGRGLKKISDELLGKVDVILSDGSIQEAIKTH